MTGFPSGTLAAAFHGGSFGVTPHTYAASGRVFRRFAAAAALQHPTILTPDVGGLALCCDEFRIVDLALLSNRKLAHRGHEALAEVLETESPEIDRGALVLGLAGRAVRLAQLPGALPAGLRGRNEALDSTRRRHDHRKQGPRVPGGRGPQRRSRSAAHASLRQSRSARGQKQLRTCRDDPRAERGRSRHGESLPIARAGLLRAGQRCRPLPTRTCAISRVGSAASPRESGRRGRGPAARGSGAAAPRSRTQIGAGVRRAPTRHRARFGRSLSGDPFFDPAGPRALHRRGG